jgi:asparagine synthase (glutamine-hydrolysing)
MESVERLSAHSGIETRHPLRSPKLVQYAFSTPERLRLRGDRTKYIHVHSLQGLMPQAVLDRTTKAEFSVLIREHLNRMQEMLTETLPRDRAAWVVPDGMIRLYQAYRDDVDNPENPQAAWAKWIMWGTFGCDRLCG